MNQKAIKQTVDKISAIEAQWVVKNFDGPTLRQERAIARAIKRFSSKYSIPYNQLERTVLWTNQQHS